MYAIISITQHNKINGNYTLSLFLTLYCGPHTQLIITCKADFCASPSAPKYDDDPSATRRIILNNNKKKYGAYIGYLSASDFFKQILYIYNKSIIYGKMNNFIYYLGTFREKSLLHSLPALYYLEMREKRFKFGICR